MSVPLSDPTLQLHRQSAPSRSPLVKTPLLGLKRHIKSKNHAAVARCLGPSPARQPRPFQTPTETTKAESTVITHAAAAVVEAAPEIGQIESLTIEQQAEQLEFVIQQVRQYTTYQKKFEVLRRLPWVENYLTTTPQGQLLLEQSTTSLSHLEAYCLVSIIAIGQEHTFAVLSLESTENNGHNHHHHTSTITATVQKLASRLVPVEEFYDCLGGILGYHLSCLRLLLPDNGTSPCSDGYKDANFLVPKGLDLNKPETKHQVATATMAGIEALPKMAEIYPLGGAGDRLGLSCEETGESLPTAVLPYCGRSLLEALIRDLQAREFLYYKLHGRQYTTPVAVMTSAAKGNHWRVSQLFQAQKWFGRGKDSFRLFQQPLVPMVEKESGKWVVDGDLEIIMKPGGHGVIWKLMLDEGVFDWFNEQDRVAAIVRQISNPMAGQDTTLIALSGEGYRGNKAFGFASCERSVGAAEGMNVLLQQRVAAHSNNGVNNSTSSSSSSVPSTYMYHITNVEYTEFEKLGIEDKGCDGSPLSQFPANTNVLYIGLPAVEAVLKQGVAEGSVSSILPGTILNTSKAVCCTEPHTGQQVSVKAGRLECTMQNLADKFEQPLPKTPNTPEDVEKLSTFLVYGPRRKVTSSAKRALKPGSLKITQTPQGSFYDLMTNARDMLTTHCNVSMPELGTVQEYLDNGPGFIFLFHPAMGPLWEVVGQKINGGKIASRSELQLEITEAMLKNVDIDGSLLVKADSVLGHYNGTSDGNGSSNNPQLVYSDKCGRVVLHNVTVRNQGVDWENTHNVYWRHKVAHKETCRIVLHGMSEFHAEDVVLCGDLKFEVPDGFRMTVTAGGDELDIQLEAISKPTWKWKYSMSNDNQIKLEQQQL